MALLEVCDEKNYLYSIERIPRSEPDSGYDDEAQIFVGVRVRKAWKYREGDNLAPLVVELLLSEYLDRFA